MIRSPAGVNDAALAVFAVVSLAAILASLFGLTWFHMDFELSGQIIQARTLGTSGQLDIGIHRISACTGLGVCQSVDLSNFTGPYPTLAAITFWASVGLVSLVAIQAGIRLVSGQPASTPLTQLGCGVAVICFVTGAFAGYLFHPEGFTSQYVTVVVHRSWVPALAMVGYVAAIQTLRLAIAELDMPAQPAAGPRAMPYERRATGALNPTTVAPPVARRVPDSIPLSAEPDHEVGALGDDPFTPPPPASRVPDSIPLSADTFEQVVETNALEPVRESVALPVALPVAPPVSPPVAPPVSPLVTPQPRGRLRFATARVALGEAGIAGEQEDGTICRAAWTGLVGVIARRLPAAGAVRRRDHHRPRVDRRRDDADHAADRGQRRDAGGTGSPSARGRWCSSSRCGARRSSSTPRRARSRPARTRRCSSRMRTC